MQAVFALALLVFVAATPAPQSLMPTPPKVDLERQCAAVLFADSGDVVVSSGKRCGDAVKVVKKECLKENAASACKDEPYTAERSWVVIFYCEDAQKGIGTRFFLASEDRTVLQSGTEEQAEKAGYKISQCVGLMTFHSSEDK